MLEFPNSIWLTLEVCFEEWRAKLFQKKRRHWVVWDRGGRTAQRSRGWVARSLKVGPLGIWSWNLCSGFDFAWLLFFLISYQSIRFKFFLFTKGRRRKTKMGKSIKIPVDFHGFSPSHLLNCYYHHYLKLLSRMNHKHAQNPLKTLPHTWLKHDTRNSFW